MLAAAGLDNFGGQMPEAQQKALFHVSTDFTASCSSFQQVRIANGKEML
jgi:hypothetical protein